jgi:hypothetical protein
MSAAVTFDRTLLATCSKNHRLAAFSLRATVDDVESEKEVPIADTSKKRSQPICPLTRLAATERMARREKWTIASVSSSAQKLTRNARASEA